MEETERKPIFANTYVPSAETYRQMYRRIRMAMTWFTAILFGAAAIFAIYKLLQLTSIYGGSIFGSVYPWLMVAMAAYMIFAIIFIAFAPRRLAKKAMKRLQEMSGGKTPAVRADFFDDTVEFHNDATNGETVLRYPVFKKCEETEDLFLLWTQQKQVVPLAKYGFSGVTIEGFRAFMDGKCPNAKRKWKKGDN